MTESDDLRLRLNDALATVEQLTAENRRLRRKVGLDRVNVDVAGGTSTPQGAHAVDAAASPAAKVALFRSLFRGRDDIYAAHWTSADGRTGYSPVLLPGVRRERGRPVHSASCAAVSDEVIRDHLSGRRTLGIYPLLPNETTWLLAMDFDKATWMDDVSAVGRACDELGLSAAVERSRSGQGAHLWLFFTRPIAAALARNLGSTVLTRALETRHQIGFGSYDRLFPSQDTMPKGGFGNLIALPLQGTARKSGNTVFLDRCLEPHEDQWRYISAIRRVDHADAERIVGDAARQGRIIGVRGSWSDDDEGVGEPWTLLPSRRSRVDLVAGPLPSTVVMTVANRIFVETKDLPAALLSRLRGISAFQNPEFYRAQRMRLPTFGKPRVIDCSEDFRDHLALPRGCEDAVVSLLKSQRVGVNSRDERLSGTAIDVAFSGQLTGRQLQALDALVRHDIGVLSAPTAFGKTVVGAALIAKRKTNTLVLVHRQHLLDQWRERLAAFLDVPLQSIGQIGGGRRKPTGLIDVGLLQSLTSKGVVNDVVGGYGHVIIDECHHIPAFSFERVLGEMKSRFVLGLTATPIRKDGHHPIIVMQCGPVRHVLDPKEEAEARPFDHIVIPRRTRFVASTEDGPILIQALYAKLARDEVRTTLIVDDVLAAIAAGRSPLVLTERTDHLRDLCQQLEGHGAQVIALQGGAGPKARRLRAQRLAGVADEEPRVLVATGRYIGEGFDDHRLDTLFLALPVSWRGTVQQYAGRLHRLHHRKRVVQIYDYVDASVPMLARMYERRLRGYAAIGYVVAPDAALVLPF